MSSVLYVNVATCGRATDVHLACFYVTADSGKRKKKGNELEQIDCTPPEHILPGSKERPLVPLQPQNKDWKVRSSDSFWKIDAKSNKRSIIYHFPPQQQPMQCLKVLTMSGWNPPPGNRKMHGDLMYLYIVTVEERHVSLTASTRGFYLNQSVNMSTSYLCSH